MKRRRSPIPHTIPFLLTIDETFDVGADTRTPVDDKDYQVPFRFSGKIGKVSIKLGPDQLLPADCSKTSIRRFSGLVGSL